MKHLQLLTLSIVAINGFIMGQTKVANLQPTNKDDCKTLTTNEYSIDYPANWDLDKSGQMGTSFFLFSKQSSPQDRFRENVNLMVQNLKGMHIDLDKYVEISENQIKSMIQNSNLILSKRLTANGNSFHQVAYTGDQGSFKLKFEQYYWVINEKAYVLTLTCEASQFDAYSEIGEKILSSFRIK